MRDHLSRDGFTADIGTSPNYSGSWNCIPVTSWSGRVLANGKAFRVPRRREYGVFYIQEARALMIHRRHSVCSKDCKTLGAEPIESMA